MFEFLGERRQVGRRRGPDTGWIKRGGVVGVGSADTTIWGATG